MPKKLKDEKTNDLFAYAEDNRASVVYVATNKTNGHRYIGITRLTLDKRRKAHFKEAKFGRSRHKSYFYNAIRYFGEDAFVFGILKHCDTYREAGAEEVRLIAETKPEYNMSPGGDGLIGYRASAETRRKLSESHQGQIGNWLGKKRPDIAAMQRERWRCKTHSWIGVRRGKPSPESRAKMSKAHRDRGWTEKQAAGNYRKRIPVVCLNDGRIFMGGGKEAAEFYGLRYDCVMGILCGKQRTTGGGLRFAKLKDVVSDEQQHDGLQSGDVKSSAGGA